MGVTSSSSHRALNLTGLTTDRDKTTPARLCGPGSLRWLRTLKGMAGPWRGSPVGTPWGFGGNPDVPVQVWQARNGRATGARCWDRSSLGGACVDAAMLAPFVHEPPNLDEAFADLAS
jgi:hypothetical protein